MVTLQKKKIFIIKKILKKTFKQNDKMCKNVQVQNNMCKLINIFTRIKNICNNKKKEP